MPIFQASPKLANVHKTEEQHSCVCAAGDPFKKVGTRRGLPIHELRKTWANLHSWPASTTYTEHIYETVPRSAACWKLKIVKTSHNMHLLAQQSPTPAST